MPILRNPRLEKYRLQQYKKRTGEGVNGDGRTVRAEPSPLTVPSPVREFLLSQKASEKATKKAEDKPLTRCELKIPDEDWSLWRNILSSARQEAGLTVSMTKENIELILTRGGKQDAYNQRVCEIPGLRKTQITYSVDLASKRLMLLALRSKMKGPTGFEERVATRTSIAHHLRTGNSPWLALMFAPESRIRDVSVDLLRDLPEDDEISFYEYPLRIAEKRREVKKLRAEYKAVLEIYQAREDVLKEKEREIEDLEVFLRADGRVADESHKNKVSSLEGEVMKLQHANLILENEKRSLKRKMDSKGEIKKARDCEEGKCSKRDEGGRKDEGERYDRKMGGLKGEIERLRQAKLLLDNTKPSLKRKRDAGEATEEDTRPCKRRHSQ